jgi:hypothetical protein
MIELLKKTIWIFKNEYKVRAWNCERANQGIAKFVYLSVDFTFVEIWFIALSLHPTALVLGSKPSLDWYVNLNHRRLSFDLRLKACSMSATSIIFPICLLKIEPTQNCVVRLKCSLLRETHIFILQIWWTTIFPCLIGLLVREGHNILFPWQEPSKF